MTPSFPWTLEKMRNELFARGFSYLNDGTSGGAGFGRATKWLNDSMHEINDLEQWVFLQATQTGAAPVAIDRLGMIEQVIDVQLRRVLRYMDRRAITDYVGDVTLTGSVPCWFYLTQDTDVNAFTTVNAFPVTAATLTIHYYKVDLDLEDLTDEPSMPDRFRYAIVEYAVAKALRDKSNYQEAAAAEASGLVIVQRMRDWNVLQAGAGSPQVMLHGSLDG